MPQESWTIRRNDVILDLLYILISEHLYGLVTDVEQRTSHLQAFILPFNLWLNATVCIPTSKYFRYVLNLSVCN
jgi:hypothetical protein